MRFTYDHDLHIHTQLSLCSGDPEQNTANILKYACDRGLKTVCITDHFWDENVPGASDWYKIQNFDHVSNSLPLPKADGVEFLFGCETDMDRLCTVGVGSGVFDKFDFILVPTTHLHMTGFTLTEEDAASDERRARLWVSRFDALLGAALPWGKVGVAHLTCGLFNNRSHEAYLETLEKIPSYEMERLFGRAAELGLGIELNAYDMKFSDADAETVLRPYRIAKEMGCKFFLGSDAHVNSSLYSAKELFERAIDLLELSEKDKFIISK